MSLAQSYDSYTSVSDPAPPRSFVSSGHFMAFSSRDSITKEIINAIMDETVNTIGVYGMGGTGKTTLMKELANVVMEKDHQLFDQVVMTIVSQCPDLSWVQNDFASNLGIPDFKPTDTASTTNVRANQLKLRLSQNRILVIFDDVWEKLNLKDDFLMDFKGNQKSLKVIFTTRRYDLCTEMKTQKIIGVDVLSEQDSLDLFQQQVGDFGDSHVLNNLARRVVKQCGGLPLAISTLGRALRGRHQSVWQSAAYQLERSIYYGTDSPVFTSIMFSYDHLKNEQLKHCFLFCCFFPEDWELTVAQLLFYMMAEESMRRDNFILEEETEKLKGLLGNLVDSCLLLELTSGKDLMHDVVRDAALRIASNVTHGFFVRAAMGLTRWPDRNSLSGCKRISLMVNQISKLPDQPECPQLLALSLYRNPPLSMIPNSFFGRMTSLVALNLGKTGISSLPTSISGLVDLRTLCLEGNPLQDVSIVGGLTKLILLDLSGTEIRMLPEGFGKLTNLKSLNLSYTLDLESIPRNIFPRLTFLEELNMFKSFGGWEMEDVDDGTEATLSELASLQYLISLQLFIDDAGCVSNDIFFRGNLQNFNINVGNIDISDCYEMWMHVNLTGASGPISDWVRVLLRRALFLDLCDCTGFETIEELDWGGFNNLIELSILNCVEMKYLVLMVEGYITFAALERLSLDGMEKLESFYSGPLSSDFLKKVKCLIIGRCPKLVTALSSDLLKIVLNLEELSLRSCDNLNEVFNSEELEEEDSAIPALSCLQLDNLEMLSIIWKGVVPRGSFEELKKVNVSDCHGLTYLFSKTMVERLEKLEHLSVYSCYGMVEIVKSEEGAVEETMEEGEQVLPRLKKLELDRLPKLSSFYRSSTLSDWPSLEYLHVVKCPNLKRLPIGPESTTNLKVFFGSGDWFEGLELEDQTLKPRLQTLFEVDSM